MTKEYKIFLEQDNLYDKFYDNVGLDDNCWEWLGATTEYGYGKLHLYNPYNKKRSYSALAHRISWIIQNGEIPKRKVICHHCDNPPCVRPNHLFLGTYKDNYNDMVKKGRRVTTRKLSLNEIKELLVEVLVEDKKYKDAARQYGINRNTIRRYVNKYKYLIE